MTTLLIATRNAHKVREIKAILGAPFLFLTLNDFPAAPQVREDADTFAGNAAKKAGELARWLASRPPVTGPSPQFVIADDSGLEVDALNGAPGVHSARFAAGDGKKNSPDAENNAKLLRLLQDVPQERRTGRFRCVLALVPVGEPAARIFAGACEGRIQWAASGHGGFGYAGRLCAVIRGIGRRGEEPAEPSGPRAGQAQGLFGRRPL
jgi:XTP/dITP diphosphohydrolase